MFNFACQKSNHRLAMLVPCTFAPIRSMHWGSFRDYLRVRAEELFLQVHAVRDALVNSVDLRLRDRARLQLPYGAERGGLVATPAHTTQTWRFGVFEVDAHKEELRRAGIPIKIREQSLRILVFLLEHAGEIVTREELRQVLWPADTFVDFAHSLNTAVMKLREALGDTADKPLYIETVPKRGYRFIAPISLTADLQNNNAASRADSAAPRTGDENEVRQAAGAPARVSGGRPRIERIAVAVVGLVLLVGAGSLIYIRTLHDCRSLEC